MPNYLPTGWSGKELSPKIIITNNSDVTQYTFEAKSIASNPASPTQDFKVTDLELDLGVNDSYGTLVFTIMDNNAALVDGTFNAESDIHKMWNVQLYLGKTNATLYRAFYGKIFDVQMDRTDTNVLRWNVVCVGWGVVLKDRATRLIRNQKKTSDGITLDDTDTTTRLDTLITAILDSKDHYLEDNMAQMTSITHTGLCSDCLNIKVANVNETYNTFAAAINRYARLGNLVWGVDADRDLWVRDPIAHDSGFIATNNESATSTINWPVAKLCYLYKAPLRANDSASDTLYSWLHGYGAFSPSLDVSYVTTEDALGNLDNRWFAIKVNPTVDSIKKLAIKAIRTGSSLSGNAQIQIRGDDGTGKPDATDIRRTIDISQHTLSALGTSTPGNWFEIPVTPKLEITPNESIHIILKMYGSASNTYNVGYKSGSGTFHDSTDGTTWTARTGNPLYRVYEAKRILYSIEMVDVAADIGIREKLIPFRADLEEQTVRQALISAGEMLSKVRREYDEIVVSAPTSRIELGKFMVIEDVKSGLNLKANIVGMSLEMHGSGGDQIGTNIVRIKLDNNL